MLLSALMEQLYHGGICAIMWLQDSKMMFHISWFTCKTPHDSAACRTLFLVSAPPQLVQVGPLSSSSLDSAVVLIRVAALSGIIVLLDDPV